MFYATVDIPTTESSSMVRPIVGEYRLGLSTLASDYPLVLAEHFIRGLVGSLEGVSADVAERGIALLRRLRREMPGLRTPTLSPGVDGLLGMTWEDERQHINIEILPGAIAEYFAEDLVTGELWSADAGDTMPPHELTERLRRMG